MLTQRCYYPDAPRHGDDLCHIECLQLEAYQLQKQMYGLQQALRDQLVMTNDALRQLTKALKDFHVVVGAATIAAGGVSGGEA